ncbi:lipoprotein [Spiroplasma poulsonii]|nr:lipoprotein [Spiroplasma poulsonii]UNF62713.1 lipoprotein [Spiroplasma poulsonii]
MKKLLSILGAVSLTATE